MNMTEIKEFEERFGADIVPVGYPIGEIGYDVEATNGTFYVTPISEGFIINDEETVFETAREALEALDGRVEVGEKPTKLYFTE